MSAQQKEGRRNELAVRWGADVIWSVMVERVMVPEKTIYFNYQTET